MSVFSEWYDEYEYSGCTADTLYKYHDSMLFALCPDMQAYLRLTVNGEFDEEYEPGALTLVTHNGRGNYTRTPHLYDILPDEEFDAGDRYMGRVLGAPIAYSGWVYIIQRDNLYKIGRTQDLHARLDSLMRTYDYDGIIHCIATDDDRKLERTLHRHFARVRMGGEWFALKGSAIYDLRLMLAVFFDASKMTISYPPTMLSNLWMALPGKQYRDPEYHARAQRIGMPFYPAQESGDV